jgi:uncharacterized protein YuzE
MNKNDVFVMDTDYDRQHDSLFMYVKDDYTYKESIELGNNIILDFDENYVPVAIEILDASKVLSVNKFSLSNPFNVEMEISVNEKRIKIEASFKVFLHQKEMDAPVNIESPNNIDLPNMQTHFAIATA